MRVCDESLNSQGMLSATIGRTRRMKKTIDYRTHFAPLASEAPELHAAGAQLDDWLQAHGLRLAPIKAVRPVAAAMSRPSI
jgi:hypothetical protein